MASGSNFGGTREISPGNRKKTSLADCMCSICMCILVEPVTMPCSHELCMPCFKQNVQEASLTCPMCRLRISSWARKAARHNALVDQKRWKQIQELFPEKVKNRLDGKEDDIEDEEFFPTHPQHLSQPGEIRREYEEELKKQRELAAYQKQLEEQASQQLIEQLRKEEERQLQELERQRLSDEALAKQLSERMEKEGQEFLSSPDFQNILKNIQSRNSIRQNAIHNGNNTLDKFLTKVNKEKSSDTDEYPYRCLTPSQKVPIETEPVPNSPLLDLSDPNPLNQSNTSDTSCVLLNSTNSSGLFSGNLNSSNASVILLQDSNIPKKNVRIGKSRSATATVSSGAINLSSESNNFMKPSSAHSNRSTTASSASETEILINEIAAGGSCEVEMRKGTNSSGNEVLKRSVSAQSGDSITPEISHFKPIEKYPKTPPRPIPGGKTVDPPVIISTPRNLSRASMCSPRENDPPGLNTTSPVVMRRLQRLAEERQAQVVALSKSTSTENQSSSSVISQDHSYSSPKKGSKVKSSECLTLPVAKQPKTKRSPVDSKAEVQKTIKSLAFHFTNKDQAHEFVDLTEHEDKPRNILPLESNFEDEDLMHVNPAMISYSPFNIGEMNVVQLQEDIRVKPRCSPIEDSKLRSKSPGEISTVKSSPGKVYQMKKKSLKLSKGKTKKLESKSESCVSSSRNKITKWLTDGKHSKSEQNLSYVSKGRNSSPLRSNPEPTETSTPDKLKEDIAIVKSRPGSDLKVPKITTTPLTPRKLEKRKKEIQLKCDLEHIEGVVAIKKKILPGDSKGQNVTKIDNKESDVLETEFSPKRRKVDVHTSSKTKRDSTPDSKTSETKNELPSSRRSRRLRGEDVTPVKKDKDNRNVIKVQCLNFEKTKLKAPEKHPVSASVCSSLKEARDENQNNICFKLNKNEKAKQVANIKLAAKCHPRQSKSLRTSRQPQKMLSSCSLPVQLRKKRRIIEDPCQSTLVFVPKKSKEKCDETGVSAEKQKIVYIDKSKKDISKPLHLKKIPKEKERPKKTNPKMNKKCEDFAIKFDDGNSETRSLVSSCGSKSDIGSIDEDLLTQEERDTLLAKKLQKQFELEARLHMTANRSRGSGEEYLFRKRKSSSAFSPIASHTRSKDETR